MSGKVSDNIKLNKKLYKYSTLSHSLDFKKFESSGILRREKGWVRNFSNFMYWRLCAGIDFTWCPSSYVSLFKNIKLDNVNEVTIRWLVLNCFFFNVDVAIGPSGDLVCCLNLMISKYLLNHLIWTTKAVSDLEHVFFYHDSKIVKRKQYHQKRFVYFGS